MSRRARLVGALVGSVVGFVGVVGSGCAAGVSGDFDGVVFAPTATAVAVYDAHTVLERNGAFVPAERPRADRKIDLWLSGASVPADEDWRFLDDARLLDVRKDLATNDLLVLRGLSFDALNDGERLVASDDDAAPAFDVAVQHAPLDLASAAPAAQNGLGSRVTVEVEPDEVAVDDDAGTVSGTFSAKVFVRRQRAVGQPANNVATGEVVLTVNLPFLRERLGEANLAVVAPIARCGAARGPAAAAACADVPRDEIVDENGRH